MKELLFLCHRMPYPPNKGDKIRAYHWLKALSERYRVHLGTFVDDPDDWAHRSVLDALTDQQCYRTLKPLAARIRSTTGFLNNRALSVGYYRDARLAGWVDEILATRPIEHVFVFSSTMATYVDTHEGCRRVLDFVDVDSDKWRQYAAKCTGVARWIYTREANRLLAEERRLAGVFDASLFVSDAEADFFRDAAPESSERVGAIGNGVDSVFFDPDLEHDDPYRQPGAARVVFTGVMDYGANVDAVEWFVQNVWPAVRTAQPDAQFWIVGTRPTRQVLALAEHAGVHVTGAVADVRPYLAHASVAVAPMRIARGIQNKVLEALAMGRAVVMSEQAAAGLEPADEAIAAIAESAEAFARAVLAYVDQQDHGRPLPAARSYVTRYYGWQRQFERLYEYIEPGQGNARNVQSAAVGASA
ncbi:TIGR03087 family PEP-CTERM/XrtA system glycosyltransferase [Salinisphaera aquimarina]|uniref:TIGR03087 family PEP-CTERM/XrtA system glycosyltransferase n=1 Tax=Salinisphaera aquimarina TaxID=2094031 RepID=A0ABV7ESD8_9GAMM